MIFCKEKEGEQLHELVSVLEMSDRQVFFHIYL